MKQLFKYLLSLLILYGMISCNTSEKKPSPITSDQNQFSELRQFTIDTSGIFIIWTAYKFTNKVAVSGTFDAYTFDTKNTSGTIENILDRSKLSIPTASVNSNNTLRDFKLNVHFFKVFNTIEITGTILKAKNDEGVINVLMNGTSTKIPFTYSVQKDTIRLFTHLDLNDWKGGEALTTLNTECYELHKGTDGVSKLWPDVDVTIKLPVHRKVN